MKKQVFDDLVASIKQAGKIHRGEVKPSRTFVFQPEEVREIRDKLHKSQSEFARMIGVSVSTLTAVQISGPRLSALSGGAPEFGILEIRPPARLQVLSRLSER